MFKAGIGRVKSFSTVSPVAAPLHTFTHPHTHTHTNMPPRGVTICRGVAVFLHRAIVMQAKVGSQSHSLTSAGHCGCKCGLIVLHGGTRRGKTNPTGLDREGFTGSLVFVSFSSSGFFFNMSTFSLPLLFFSVWVSDCCQTRHMTQRDVHGLYTHRHAHTHKHSHAHTHTCDGLLYMYRVLEK